LEDLTKIQPQGKKKEKAISLYERISGGDKIFTEATLKRAFSCGKPHAETGMVLRQGEGEATSSLRE